MTNIEARLIKIDLSIEKVLTGNFKNPELMISHLEGIKENLIFS